MGRMRQFRIIAIWIVGLVLAACVNAGAPPNGATDKKKCWLTQAAEKGNADAFYALGRLYEGRAETSPDKAKYRKLAYAFFLLSRDAAVPAAQQKLDAMAVKMSPSEIDEAIVIAGAWMREYLPPKAPE